jgi:LysM repeat protein/ABC-type branched-subunit amino acid transport system substrate-binding protein
MKIYIALSFLLFTSILFAQPSVAKKELVNGRKYYVHIVEEGNTVYGLQKLYNVPQSEILASNPGIEKGLSIGKKLLIPVPLVTVDHTVKQKETLYGIAKRYGVSADSITKHNPIVSSGIKVGQVLKIKNVERELTEEPLFSDNAFVTEENQLDNTPIIVDTVVPKYQNVGYSMGDTLISYTVMDGETLYGLSKRFMISVDEIKSSNNLKNTALSKGMVLKLKVAKEISENVAYGDITSKENGVVTNAKVYPVKDHYKIALLLPFYLDKGAGYSESIQIIATDFYMGAKLALDTLEGLGLNADFHVFDMRNDSVTLKKILQSDEFQDVDIVFGPLLPDHSTIVAKWCAEHNARMVCPAIAPAAVLKNNPHVYHAVASDATLMAGMAKYILKNNSKDQIILVKTAIEKEMVLYESFRNAFMNETIDGTRPKLVEATPQNFKTFIKSNVKNVIVFPTNDKGQAITFMNNLISSTQKLASDKIQFYGTKDWVNFDDLKSIYKNRLNFRYPSPNDLNYSYQKIEDFNRVYRKKYNADLTKMAVQGYDVMLYFSSLLLLNNPYPHLLMNDFKINQIEVGAGSENSKTFIIEQEDYDLINVENNE